MQETHTDNSSDHEQGAPRDLTHIPLGLFSIALGLGTGITAWGYGVGSLREMGPGFFPLGISVLLVLLGLTVLVKRGRDLSDADLSEVDAESAAPLLRKAQVLGSVLGGLLVFALMLDHAGLFVSVVVLAAISSLGHPGPKPLPILALGLGLAVFASVLFVVVLGLNIRVWPGAF